MSAGHVVLVGMMGAGKTTIGRMLADRLARPLVDSDALIEARTGRTVREIWIADGEAAFRSLEADALRDALDDEEPAVIAAAGGVVLSAENRAALDAADATVVWLRVDPAILARRVGAADHRPLLDDEPEVALRTMLSERIPLYEAVADIVVDSSAAPETVAESVMRELSRG